MSISNAEKSARYRAKNIEGYREKKREYAKTPEQRIKRAEYMRKYREKNKESFNRMCNESHARSRSKQTFEQKRNTHLKYTYGITYEEYRRMFEEQGSCCAICGRTDSGSKNDWHVDHCHTTGVVRGILCNSCNTKLGWYEKNKLSIEKYLAQFEKENEDCV